MRLRARNGDCTVRLAKAQIQNYRSIENSTEFTIDPSVTCLVGKNESGKTAVLQALHLLNPVNPIKGKRGYDETMDFPSRRHGQYKRQREQHPANVLTATFTLDSHEVDALNEDFGPGFVTPDAEVTVTRGYEGSITYRLICNEEASVRHLTQELKLPASDKTMVDKTTNFEELREVLSGITEPPAAAVELLEEIDSWSDGLQRHVAGEYLAGWLPRFLYFDDYNVMRGNVSLDQLRNRRTADDLDPADDTFLALLNLSGLTPDDLAGANYETQKRQLESAANAVTYDVMDYWTQNPELQLLIDVSPADAAAEPPLNQGLVVRLRVWNPRHRVSVPFDERSKGFVWFFSFFAYFSDLAPDPDRATILLLDEPGLSLHAKAQEDFLRFIEQRLASEQGHQVIYTTHSPFLIDPAHLERVRTVEDVNDAGTTVGSDVHKTGKDTLFPLQGALGYSLAQTLFVGPDCLLVEGPSDLIYLQLLSQACEERGLTTLDDRWVVTPVGGADKLSTFVSLIGANQLNVAVLVDSNTQDSARLNSLRKNGHLGHDNLILITDALPGVQDADVEDILGAEFYLTLVNGSYKDHPGIPLNVDDLEAKGGRITQSVEQHFKQHGIAGGKFSHYKPAAYFLREQATLLDVLPQEVVESASRLYARINSLL